VLLVEPLFTEGFPIGAITTQRRHKTTGIAGAIGFEIFADPRFQPTFDPGFNGAIFCCAGISLDRLRRHHCGCSLDRRGRLGSLCAFGQRGFTIKLNLRNAIERAGHGLITRLIVITRSWRGIFQRREFQRRQEPVGIGQTLRLRDQKIVLGAHHSATGFKVFVFGIEQIEQGALADIELAAVSFARFFRG